MKKLFRKAMTVVGSAALVGASVGMAAAVSYPDSFTGGNTAVVVGASAAPSDNIAAGSVAANLDTNTVSTGTTTVTMDGDSYKFEKTSTKLHLGDDITSIKSELDEDEMPALLEDGTYTDDNNDEHDYTQAITVSSASLTMFDDNDYKKDDPSVGIKYGSGDTVLTYTLEFSEEPTFTLMDSTDLTMMGKTYYVLDADETALTLLDAAESTIISEGESKTISAGGKSYVVSIEYIGETTVKLKVNGEITNALAGTDTYKLDDGAYVGMKEILYTSKDTGISKAEFSIGNGKLVLPGDGSEVEMNEDTIDGLTSTISNVTDTLENVVITWATDDEVFVAEDSVATMPGFGAISMSFTGLDYPVEETIEVSFDGEDSLVLKDFPLKDSSEDINLLYKNSSDTDFGGLGKDDDERLVTGSSEIIFDGDTDAYFVASYDDGSDAESYLMRATNFKTENTENKTTFEYMKDGSWTDAKTDRANGDSFSVGNVELMVNAIDKLAKTVNVTADNANTNFNTLYSAEGLKVFLPVEGSSTSPAINFSASPTSYVIQFVEEDKDGDTAVGDTFTVTAVANSGTDKVSVSALGGNLTDVSGAEIGDTDVERSFTYSALATEALYDKGDSDQKTVKLMYHGGEVEASVYLTSSDAVSSTGGDAGVVTYNDNELANFAGKDIIVVGGSAINSVAAELLGGQYSEAAFTSITGVSAGEFMIESFTRSSGETALLVAGYNAADTEKAVTYLINEGFDSADGSKMKGTSATEATVVTATA